MNVFVNKVINSLWCNSLAGNFDVHVVVAIIAHSHPKICHHCVECPLLENRQPLCWVGRQVYRGPIHLREEITERDVEYSSDSSGMEFSL